MKKKILAAILTAAMTIGMVGCGSTSSSDNGNNSASNTEASSNELTVWCWYAVLKENGLPHWADSLSPS